MHRHTCQLFIKMVVETCRVKSADADGYFWLPLEFPSWRVAVSTLCFHVGKQFVRDSALLWKIFFHHSELLTSELESFLTNLRCLSSKTNTTPDDLRYSLVSFKTGKKRTHSDLSSEDEGDMPPTKKRLIDSSEASLPVRLTGKSLATRDRPSNGSQRESVNTERHQSLKGSDAVDELLFHFILSQHPDKVSNTLNLVSQELQFDGKREECWWMEHLLRVERAMEDCDADESIDWVSRTASNVAILRNTSSKA